MTEMRTLDPDLTTIRVDELEPGDLLDLEPIARVFGDDEDKHDVDLGVSALCYEYARIESVIPMPRHRVAVNTVEYGTWHLPVSLLVHAIKKGQRVRVGGREMEV